MGGNIVICHAKKISDLVQDEQYTIEALIIIINKFKNENRKKTE